MPEPNQLVVKLDPTHGHQADRRRTPGRRGRAGPRRARPGVRRAGRRGPDARTRCSSTRRSSADPMRFTRQDAVEETWRIMQPLLDSPPPVHPYAPGSWGPEDGDELWSPATAAGTAPGSPNERAGNHDRDGAAERRGAVAVPADRRLRLPLQLPHRRARRPGRRDRLAVRPGLRLAERLRQPARPRGRLLPARRRSGSTIPPRAPTSRARTCS